ncbi:MAG TPA: DUF423 domain-containing protein [Verrucomicrobiales bacterium]|nr:DUF423 domain-containing protein [Verrucomicrobiales bacterium]
MTRSLLIRFGSGLTFLAVALGAFGAHGLHDLLARNATAHTWETAVLYHFVHSLALLLLAALTPGVRSPRGPALCFLAGILLFSGSLYALALTGVKLLGAITPLGGVAFLVGWACVALTGLADRGERGAR